MKCSYLANSDTQPTPHAHLVFMHQQTTVSTGDAACTHGQCTQQQQHSFHHALCIPPAATQVMAADVCLLHFMIVCDVQVEPLDPDSDSDSRRCSSQRSSSAGTLQCNAAHPPGQQTQHRLSHQSSYSSIHSSSRNSMQCPLSPSGPSAPALSSSFYPLPVLGHSTVLSNNGHGAASPSAARHVPVHALGLSSNTTWRATGGAVTMGVEYTTATADSIVSHQAFLTSFPVEDYDLLECMPESPTSSQADELDDDTLDTAAADEQPSIGRALSAVQGAVDSCTVLVQHLLVPHLLFEHGPRQGRCSS